MSTRNEGRDLFEQHLRLMGGGSVAPNDRDEAERVASMRLPPLTLGQRRRRPVAAWLLAVRSAWERLTTRGAWTVGSAVAATAAIAVFFLPTAPQWLAKGGTRIDLVWQRDGATLPWRGAGHTRGGDRFSAEVVADRPLAAFLGVYDGSGRLLSDPNMMLKNHLELSPGERASFSQGFELTEVDEGEEAAVFTCDLAAFSAETDRVGFVEHLVARGGCTITRFLLR